MNKLLGNKPDMKILVHFINGIGDAILALPLLNYLSETYSERITIVAPYDIISYVFCGLRCKKYAIVLNRERGIQLSSFSKELNELLCEPFDSYQYLLSLNAYRPLHTSEEMIRKHFSFQKIYQFENNKMNEQKTPMLIQYFKIAELDVNYTESRKLAFDQRLLLYAQKLCDKIRNKFSSIVSIHMDTVSQKEWTLVHWVNFMDLLHVDLNCHIFILGMEKKIPNLPYVKKIESNWHKQAAVLFHSDFFFGVDSCWGHMADSMDKTGVILFSKYSDPEIWGPLSDNMHYIQMESLKKVSPKIMKKKIFDLI